MEQHRRIGGEAVDVVVPRCRGGGRGGGVGRTRRWRGGGRDGGPVEKRWTWWWGKVALAVVDRPVVVARWSETAGDTMDTVVARWVRRGGGRSKASRSLSPIEDGPKRRARRMRKEGRGGGLTGTVGLTGTKFSLSD